jgi:CRISPR-associated protein Cas5t
MTSVGSGRVDKAWGYAKNVEIQTNVLPRQILLHPSLTLYLEAGERTEQWAEIFRSPAYPVLLGRSQDLAAYSSVELIELKQADFGYLENTLLPWTMRDRLPFGTTFQMPKFVNPSARQSVTWERYVVLDRRLWWPNSKVEPPPGAKLALRQSGDAPMWIDPNSPAWGEGHRIVIWHSWN